MPVAPAARRPLFPSSAPAPALALLTLLLGMLSAAAPAAAQTASPARGCIPFEVAFAPPSSGSAYWDFGDGASSTLTNPVHVYTLPGSYTVTFRRAAGGPALGTTTVRAFAAPTLTLAPDPARGCAPLDVSFSVSDDLDASVAVRQITWDFGDGTSASGRDVAHTYTDGGDYDVAVALTSEFASCNVTEIFADTIQVLSGPTAAFTTQPDPAQSCTLPLLVRPTNRSTGETPLTYSWTYGNAQGSDQRDPGLVAYDTRGSYRLALAVIDADGCTDSTSAAVSAGTPDPSFDLPDTVCLGAVYDFRALGAADSFTYAYGPGVTVLADQGARQTVQFDVEGPVQISLAVTNAAGGCTADSARSIFVQRLAATVVADPTFACQTPFTVDYAVGGAGLSVVWTFPVDSGVTSTALDTSVTYAYDEGGEFGYNARRSVAAGLVLTDAAGCTLDTTVVTEVDVPNARFVPDVHDGCAPLTVTFADSIRTSRALTEVEIIWGDGQQESFTRGGPWAHVYEEPGEYRALLRVTTAGGCVDTSYAVEIQVGAPVAGLSYTTEMSGGTCPGDTLTFVNTSSSDLIDRVHFQVGGGYTSHCPGEDTARHVIRRDPGGAAVPVVLYAEYNGCVDSLVDEITVTPGPIARLGYAIDCAAPFDVRFYDRAEASVTDSVLVRGLTDTTFSEAFAITDSTDLTLPARGAYRAVMVARGSTETCSPSYDTVELYITVPEAVFDLPERLCSGAPLPLDGSASQDVNATCGLGYQWEFSFDRPYSTDQPTTDGVSATAQGPQRVDLIVSDINGCRDTASAPVTLYRTDLTIVPSDDRICLPSAVDFTLQVDSDTTITSYTWDFAGQGSASGPSASFTFPDAAGAEGPLTVSVETMDALGCPGSATVDLSVYEVRAQVTTQPDPPLECEGELVQFAASDFTAEGSSLTYAWDLGNGQTSTSSRVAVRYPNAGDFAASLVYTEQATGCQGDTTVAVQVQRAPEAAFTSDIDGAAVNCYPTLATFTDGTSSDYDYTAVWYADGIVRTGPTFTNTFGRGTSTVTLVAVTSAGCTDSTSRDYTFVGPAGGFVQEPAEICVGDEVSFRLTDTTDVGSFTWDFGNGQTLDDVDPATTTYEFRPENDSTFVSLTLRSASNECTYTATSPVNFLDLRADFTTALGDGFSCGNEVTFIDRSRGATTYAYDFGNGSKSASASPTFTFPGPGDYEVSLTVTNGTERCQDVTTRTITVLDVLDLTVTGDRACTGQGAELTFTGSRPLTRLLFRDRALIATETATSVRTVPLLESTTLQITAVDTFGCQVTRDVPITVGAGYPGSGDTTVILAGASTTLRVEPTEGYTFRWLDPAAVGCPDCTSPSVAPQVTTDYILEVTDAGGCGTQTLIFRVIVLEAPIVPNLFTPNGDGANDDWGPLLPEGIQPSVDRYEVYSRWGSLVFSGDAPTDRWTGDRQDNGTEAPSDVYAYVIVFTYADGATFEDSGEVTLLR